MNTRRTIILPAAGLAVGLALGYLLGGSSQRPGQMPSAPLSDPGGRPTTSVLTPSHESTRDPTASFAALKAHFTSGQDRETTLQALAQLAPLIPQLDKRDLPEALGLLASSKNPMLKSALTSALFMRWAELDQEDALAQAEALTDLQTRTVALQGALSSWAEADADAPWEYVIKEKSGEAQTKMIGVMMSGFAMRDPATAAAWIERLESPMARSQTMQMLSYMWGAADPDGALQWASKLPNEADRRDVLPGILNTLSESDPERAFTLALQEQAPGEWQHALSSIISTVAQADPGRALEFLERLPAEVPADDVVKGMAWVLGRASLEQINGYVDTIADPETQTGILQKLIQSKVSQGGSADGLSLLSRVPAGKAHDHALHALMGSWAQHEPIEASAWLATLPGGNDRDYAIAGFSAAYLRTDPEAALTWAGSIAEPKFQNQNVKSLASKWLSTDPTAATAWIQAHSQFTAEQKEALLGPPAK